MIEILVSVGVTAITSGVTVYIVTKKATLARLDIYINEAKAKAKTIEHEAQLVLHKSKLEASQIEFNAKKHYEEELITLRSEQEYRRCEIEKEEAQVLRKLREREAQMREKEKATFLKRQRIEQEIAYVQKQKEQNEAVRAQLMGTLESYLDMPKSKLETLLIEEAKTYYAQELGRQVRKLEQESQKELKRKAHYILAQATTRFAGEFASERLVNRIELPDNELKGRIIGREGRNIKALEHLLGVDIIIDETPNMIELSSHNLYRRAIASKTLQLLIEDGRIQPARIEETFSKVTQEFEEHIRTEGEEIVEQLGVTGVHPELIKLIGKLRYRASYGQNALAHTLEVAYFAGIIAAELGGNEILARRAGLLHDIGKSMTHDVGGNHVDIGAELCTRFQEDPVVINAIYAHHEQQEIRSIECAAVCAADALSAARPGARREVMESYVKRVKEMEEIALAKAGVTQAYAINAGREIRVIVNAELLDEAASAMTARDIAKTIQEAMHYPGDVKVHVIREERFVAMAH